ncbi:MAG: response regulator [Bacteroidales bacterium]|nr:response regulator [Bacteroidales bacterium]
MTEQHTLNVLIAEDNLSNQKIIGILLKLRGWQFTVVNNGKRAVEEMENGRFDIVLMDIDMPIMDGFQATRIIRDQDEQIPIIALTAYDEEYFRKESLEAGMSGFLSKPYNKQQIYDTIERHTNGSSSPSLS